MKSVCSKIAGHFCLARERRKLNQSKAYAYAKILSNVMYDGVNNLNLPTVRKIVHERSFSYQRNRTLCAIGSKAGEATFALSRCRQKGNPAQSVMIVLSSTA